MPDGHSGPMSHSYFSQRLRLHYVDWGNEDKPPLLMVHGGRDHCRNWDWIARALRDEYHIIAPDLRGHGDSQWLVGGHYSVADYIYDIAQLIHQKKMAPVNILAHSMGGKISLLYAGTFPQSVRRIVAIEGILPNPKHMRHREETPVHDQLATYVETLRKFSSRIPKRYPTLEEACQRMEAVNPHLTRTQARHLTVHGANQNEDGTWSWKFDNYGRAAAPIGLAHDQIISLYQRIACKNLHIIGEESWVSNPTEDGRIQWFDKSRVEVIPSAGHWVHHDQPDHFLSLFREFMAEPD